MNPFDKYNNQADVVSIDKWLAKQQALNKANKQVAQKTKGNFLTHLLPTIGGTGGGVAGGAAGGALAGTAVLPGVGTVAGGLLGALLGGTAGGAAGKAVENKIEHRSIGSGVVGQGLEQGILAAGPLRLLKGASAGTKALSAAKPSGTSLVDALNAAGERAVAPSAGKFQSVTKNLVTQGQQAQGRVAGISAGSKIAGKELSPQDTQAMLQTLKTEGIKTGNANNTFRDLQDKLGLYGKQISSHFTENNTPLTRTQINGLAKDFVGSLKTTDKGLLNQAQTLAKDLKLNVNDTKGLWEFRKKLDKFVPDAKMASDENLSNKVAAYKSMRQFITKQLGDVPGAKGYHSLAEVKPFISAEAKRLNNPGGGIVGRIAASGPVQKGEQQLGLITEKAGKALGGGTPTVPAEPFGLASVAKRTVPLGALQAGIGANTEQKANMAGDQALAEAQGMDVSPDTGQLDTAEQGGSPYTQENLIADIQRDPKNADKYIQNFKDLQDIFSPAAGNKLNSTQLQQANNAVSGISSLDKIAQTLQENPTAVKLAKLPGGSLTSSLTGTGSYKAAVNNAADVIGRLRSGGAINQDEEKRFLSLLPGAFDDQETATYKLQSLYSLFDSFANPQPSQGTDLTSALLAIQGGNR